MWRHVGVGLGLVALLAAGCTSVKMVQRDGCWVRRTEKPFGRVLEEVGPCARPQPQWSPDRLTRLVQECVAQADFRAQSRALEVFSRRFPYPTPQPQKEETLRACMEEVRSGMEAERDRTEMEKRLADLTGERDTLKEDAARDRAKLFAEVAGERDVLRDDAAKDRARLQAQDERLAEWLGKSHDKMTEWLGQAAQKPPGNATASATSNSTSDGKATNDTGATLASDSGASAPSPSAAPVSSASVVLPGTPAATGASAPGEGATLPRRRAKRARARPIIPARATAPACPSPTPGEAPCGVERASTTPPAAPVPPVLPASPGGSGTSGGSGLSEAP